MKNLFFAFVIILGLSSCAKELDTATKNNSKWVLTEWPGRIMPTAAQATLNISEGNKIGGKAFCNTYGGNASFNGNSIQFSQLFSTKMFCNELAEAETKFTADLQSVNSGSVAGGKLSLMKDGQVLMVFSKAE
ncbi:META domain-containing protein [Pedobacter insulae]|uniref:Heat shock protein HslJ n=1 Tax=Pedobacter insulae TaxID=414048 RepID=A0A1I2SWS3_9SPHI|nr:META domain-containing protein [Pedobacter insulae]SFG57090.1 Heat shock protein HslJ [Pedobacter insulae]